MFMVFSLYVSVSIANTQSLLERSIDEHKDIEERKDIEKHKGHVNDTYRDNSAMYHEKYDGILRYFGYTILGVVYGGGTICITVVVFVWCCNMHHKKCERCFDNQYMKCVGNRYLAHIDYQTL